MSEPICPPIVIRVESTQSLHRPIDPIGLPNLGAALSYV